MPAIKPQYLKKQISSLSMNFETTHLFTKELLNLLESYANHIQRSGYTSMPPPLLKYYNTPKPVIKSIKQEIGPCVINSPTQAFNIVNDLWSIPSYETRILAIFVIGQLPVKFTHDILELITNWVLEEKDEKIIIEISSAGLTTIRKKNIELLINQIEKWLETKESKLWRLALHTISFVLEDESFENLPVILNIINPYIRQADKVIQPLIVKIIHDLIRKSPVEMSFVLRENYHKYHREYTAWLIRHSINVFPIEIQQNLKKSLQTSNRNL